MSDTDSIFLAVDEPVAQVSEWLADVLGLEQVSERSAGANEVRLRGRAVTDDGWLGFVVEPNGHVLQEPEPDEIQAIDAYGIEIDMKYLSKVENVLHREARLVFDNLVQARPDLPMLLCEELAILVAAHLPDRGTQYFEPSTTVDAADIEIWHPWIQG
jgi:hypothetical protein